MSPRLKHLLVVAAILVAALLGAGVYASYEYRRLVVTVRYEGPANVPAKDVELSVHGDHASVKQLLRGEERRLVLEPDGESGLVLQYKLGRRQCHWDGGYVEPSGGYRVVLSIHGCGDVKQRTSFWPR